MPYVKIEPSGTMEWHGLVRPRLDMFLEPEDYRWNDPRYYVIDQDSPEYLAGYKGKMVEEADGILVPKSWEAYNAWEASLPRIWLAERQFHTHFVRFDPYTLRDEDIENAINRHLPNFYAAWLKDYIDVPGGMRHGWDVAFRKRPTRWDKVEPETYAQRKLDCLDKVGILLASKDSFSLRVTGEGEIFPATEIDVGSAATDRASSGSSGYTVVLLDNPANDDGTIDTWEIWANETMGGVKAGTWSGSGTTWNINDYETIGAVTAGSKQTFSGLDNDVLTAEIAGIYWSSGKLELTSSGQAGALYKSGDQFGGGGSGWSSLAGYTYSLYGTGETAGAPQSITISYIARASTVQAPSVAATGSAPVTPSPITITASVVAPSVAGSGSVAITPSPITVTASVQSPSVAGSGAASITVSPIATTATVKAPVVAGTGVGTIAASSIAVVASVVAPTLSGSGVVSIGLAAIAVVASVRAPILSGSGFASITVTPLATVASVVAPVAATSIYRAIAGIIKSYDHSETIKRYDLDETIKARSDED